MCGHARTCVWGRVYSHVHAISVAVMRGVTYVRQRAEFVDLRGHERALIGIRMCRCTRACVFVRVRVVALVCMYVRARPCWRTWLAL